MKKEIVTRKELEAAVVEMAWAFYHKKTKIQYCGRGLNEKFSKNYGGAHRPPLYSKIEDATRDYELFTVCSDYCYSVYDNALNFPLLGGRMNYGTHHAWAYSGDPKEFAVIRWVSRAYNGGTYSEEDKACHLKMPLSTLEETLAFLADYEKNLRPGDVLTFYMKAGGHNLMYLGNGYILDSCGKSYDMSAGMDKREVNGSVCRLRTIQNVFLGEKCTWDLRKYDRNDTPAVFCVLRPIDLLVTERDELDETVVMRAPDGLRYNPNLPVSGFHITNSARTKMKYPGMEIDRTGSRNSYGSTFTGDILTYTVRISNNSDSADYDLWRSAFTGASYEGEDYRAVAVREKVPAGTELVSASAGAQVSGGSIVWTLDVPKGQMAEVSFSVRVTARQGETIVSDGGYVDGTPCAAVHNFVGGKKLTEEKIAALAAFADGGVEAWNSNEGCKISAKSTGTAFACRVYNEAMGMDLRLPDVQSLWESLFEQKEIKMDYGYGNVSYEPLHTWIYAMRKEKNLLSGMVIRTYLGGQYVYTDRFVGEDRINSFRSDYLEPGDIIVHGKLSPYSETGETRTVAGSNVIVYLGGRKYAALSSDGEMFRIEGESALWKAFTFDFFVGLRPSQGYADVNREVKAYDRNRTACLTGEDANRAVDPWSAEGLKKGFANLTEDSWALARFPVSTKNFGLWVYSVAGIDLSENLTQNTFVMLSHTEERGIFAMENGKYVLQDAPSACLTGEKRMLLPKAWGGDKTCGGDPEAMESNEKFRIGDLIGMYEKTDGKDKFAAAVKIDGDSYFFVTGITGVSQSFCCKFIPFEEVKRCMKGGWDIYYALRPSNIS